VLIWTGAVEAWHVAVLSFLSGCMIVLIVPARQAMLPSTVERPQLGAAIGLLSAGTNAGRVIGPSLAGMLLAVAGAALSFAVQAVGYVLALLCAAVLPSRPTSRHGQQRSAVQSLLEGLHFVWNDSTVLTLIALQAIPAFLLMPYSQLLPIFARDILHAGPEALGTLMTAMGVGSVLGSVGIVLLSARRQGMTLFLSLCAFALLLVVFAMSTSLALSVLLMGLLGVAQAVYLATNNTLIQLATPDALQGRVMSVYMMTWGLMPLGALPQGILSDRFGAPMVVAGVGLLSIVIVLMMAARSPGLRRL
jgi:predicted MFS family arabinose efflux permease